MFGAVLNQIIIMVLLMAAGFICAKTKLISVEGSRTLSNVLMMIVNPMLTFTVFQIERTEASTKGLFTTMLIAALTLGAGILLSNLFFRKDKNERGQINRFSTVYSNCGFIGIPLVYAILGAEGVICLSGYVAVFNILVWTHGYVLMSGEFNKQKLLKGILSPTMIAIAAGIVCYFGDIHVPELPLRAMQYLSDMNTPLAMLIAGSALAGADLKSTLKNRSVYLVTLLKLFVLPAAATLILCLLRIDRTIAYASLVAAACPSATVGVAFALMFRKDHAYASQIFVFTTVLSMVTIPLVIFVTETLGLW